MSIGGARDTRAAAKLHLGSMQAVLFTCVSLSSIPYDLPPSMIPVPMCPTRSASTIGGGRSYGDIVPPTGGGSQPNFGDISASVDTFRNVPRALPIPVSNSAPEEPDQNVNFVDAAATVLIGHPLLRHSVDNERTKLVARRFVEPRLPALRSEMVLVRSGDTTTISEYETLAGPLPGDR